MWQLANKGSLLQIFETGQIDDQLKPEETEGMDD
jgi:hypothetical protein